MRLTNKQKSYAPFTWSQSVDHVEDFVRSKLTFTDTFNFSSIPLKVPSKSLDYFEEWDFEDIAVCIREKDCYERERHPEFFAWVEGLFLVKEVRVEDYV